MAYREDPTDLVAHLRSLERRLAVLEGRVPRTTGRIKAVEAEQSRAPVLARALIPHGTAIDTFGTLASVQFAVPEAGTHVRVAAALHYQDTTAAGTQVYADVRLDNAYLDSWGGNEVNFAQAQWEHGHWTYEWVGPINDTATHGVSLVAGAATSGVIGTRGPSTLVVHELR